jgi:hypothetical protein
MYAGVRPLNQVVRRPVKVIATFLVGALAVIGRSMDAAEDADEVVVEAQLNAKQVHYREFRRQFGIAKSRWEAAKLANYKFRAYEIGLSGSGEHEVTVRNGVCTVRYRIGLSTPARFGRASVCNGQSMNAVLAFIGDHSGLDTDADFDQQYGYVRSVTMIDYGYRVTEFTTPRSSNPSSGRRAAAKPGR